MRELQIVMAIIEQNDLYHLQFRDGPKRIGAAGLIGCFGGKIEPGETPLQAVCREVGEETNLQTEQSDFTHLGEVNVIADNNLEPVKIHSEVFKMTVSAGFKVEAREGALVSLDVSEAEAKLATMTPGTKATFEQFILGGERG